jgi:hypothetical protein
MRKALPTLLLSIVVLVASPAPRSQVRPPAHCHASVVTKLMFQTLTLGPCPSYRLTAHGREMAQLADNVIAFMAVGNARSACLREGQRKYEAAVQELGAEVDRTPRTVDARACRVAALFLDRLHEGTSGEPYYQRKGAP